MKCPFVNKKKGQQINSADAKGRAADLNEPRSKKQS